MLHKETGQPYILEINAHSLQGLKIYWRECCGGDVKYFEKVCDVE
jgi:hypothetical protein